MAQESKRRLRGAGLDEPRLLQAIVRSSVEHGESIRILHTLTPVGVAMAGATNSIRIRIEMKRGRISDQRLAPAEHDAAHLSTQSRNVRVFAR